ncbi:MAG: hypothetical protein JKY53_11920 [Flavobacteriales bacterium]|nr:hypothetical protein [Flavobacteriales bacterium]
MRILLFLITFLVTCASSFGQAGFLGKRMYTLYNFGIAPAMVNPTFNGAKKTLRFNTNHNFTLGYVLSNVRAIEIGFGYTRTSIDHEYNSSYSSDLYNVGNAELIGEIGYDELLPELKMVSYRYNINWIAYANQGVRLAPLGVYSAYGISLLDSYIGEKYDDELYFFSNIKSLLLSYSLGNRRIIFNSIMLDYSIGSTLNLSIVTSGISNTKMKSAAQERIQTANFLIAKLGIGLVY